MSFKVSHHHSVWGLDVVWIVPLPFTGVAQSCLRCPTFSHWGGSASFKLYKFCSLGWVFVILGGSASRFLLRWFCIISGVSLLFIGVAFVISCVHLTIPGVVWNHLRFPNATHWVFSVYTSVQLPLSRVAQHHPRCHIAAFLGSYASLQKSHFHSLG